MWHARKSCLPVHRGDVEPEVAVYSPYFVLNLLEIVARYK